MVERRARDANIDRLCPRRFQHGLGLRDVGLRGDAAAEAVLRQFERFLERLHRRIQQLPIPVDAAQA